MMIVLICTLFISVLALVLQSTWMVKQLIMKKSSSTFYGEGGWLVPLLFLLIWVLLGVALFLVQVIT